MQQPKWLSRLIGNNLQLAGIFIRISTLFRMGFGQFSQLVDPLSLASQRVQTETEQFPQPQLDTGIGMWHVSAIPREQTKRRD